MNTPNLQRRHLASATRRHRARLAVICIGIVLAVAPAHAQIVGPSVGQVLEIMRWAQKQIEIQQFQAFAQQEMMLARASFDKETDRLIKQMVSAVPYPPTHELRYGSNGWGAAYTVPFGRYSGDALVGMTELIETRPPDPPRTIVLQLSHGRKGLRNFAGGWTFEPGGMLKESYDVVELTSNRVCRVVNRFQYVQPNGVAALFQQRGIEPACTFQLASGFPANGESCVTQAPPSCRAATQYTSTDGQLVLDVTSRSTPQILYPNGTVETLSTEGSYIPFNPGLHDFFPGENGSRILGKWFTAKVVDRNGNPVLYAYDEKGFLASITDADGRVTEYMREKSGLVGSIVKTGPNGNALTWTLTWEERTWDPSVSLSDITCIPQACSAMGTFRYTTLRSLQIPDGRTYEFSYEDWGRLKSIRTPAGAVTEFDYGGPTTPAFSPESGAFSPAAGTFNLHRRRVTAIRDFPNGSGTPSTTTIEHNEATQFPSNSTSHCSSLQWIVKRVPDGAMIKEGRCVNRVGIPNVDYTFLYGRPFATEIWQNGRLLNGTYFGSLPGIGETTVQQGDFFADWETAASPDIPIAFVSKLDVRPTKLIHKSDGVLWSESTTYEDGVDPANPECTGCVGVRTTGNITGKTVRDATGSIVQRTQTSFYHATHSQYRNSNMIRLPEVVLVRGDGFGLISKIVYAYDEFPLRSSNAINLEPHGTRRGNLTTTTTYEDPAKETGAIHTVTTYFDTGDVYQQTDPGGHLTTLTPDARLCSQTPRLVTSSRNALGHTTSQTLDCETNLVLSSTDVNGETSYMQYDNLGRLVESAGPGDSLSLLPTDPPDGYLRLPGAPTISCNGAPCDKPGANGRGPTSWTDYKSLGEIGRQHIVEHRKDGTPDGLYKKTFLDGAERPIQTRSEADPVVGGGPEIVATTRYDVMGRVSAQLLPCSDVARDEMVECTSPATTTTYDALARPVAIVAPGNIRTDFEHGGASPFLVTTATNPRRFVMRTLTDILGRTRELQRASDRCANGWCVESTDYDPGNRPVSMRDPAGNEVRYVYDGLGRKREMFDPDLGHWTYDYDLDGNLTRRTDANGAVIAFEYDALHRLIRKDMPGTQDDVTYFYDGNGPQPPPVGTCTYTISQSTNNVSAAGGTFTVNVTTSAPTCSWSTTGAPSWIAVQQGSGSGNGQVQYFVSTNDSAARQATLVIAGLSHTVIQDGATVSCTFQLSSSGISVGAGSQSFSVGVATQAGCNWNTTNIPSWITATTASGTGNGTAQFNVLANTGASRSATLTIAGQPFTVTQAAASCTYSLGTSSASVGASGGAVNVAVSAGAGCAWQTTGLPSWITAVESSGSGNGTARFNVAANTGPQRNATITIAGLPFSITQAGGCSYTLGAGSANVPPAGGSIQVSVSTGAGCAWTTTGIPSWIIANTASGTGSGNASFTAQPNGGPDRTATLTIAGTPFVVTQAGCTYALGTSTASIPKEGGTALSVSVTAPNSCAWTTSGAPAWIAIVSGSGSGNGQMLYDVQPNPGPARQATLTVATKPFTVQQASGCTFSINPEGNLSVPPAGSANNIIAVGASNTLCTWTAVSTASWVRITSGASGAGNGTVIYTVDPNNAPGATFRSATIVVAGFNFIVTQEACGLFVTPTSRDFSYTSDSDAIDVSASGGCSWTSSADAPWITISTPSGSGSGRISYSVSTNTSTTYPTSRTGTITVTGAGSGTRTVTITQQGKPPCNLAIGISKDAAGLQSFRSNCFASAGGTATIYVWLGAAATGCNWTPASNAPWLRITGVTNNGSDPRIVTYAVDPSAAAAKRIGTISIGGVTHQVTQTGSSSSASGRVTTIDGRGLAGVKITFSALTFDPALPQPVFTDANGYWSQSGFEPCKGHFASASIAGYTFDFNKRGFSRGDINVDFTAKPVQ